MDFVNKFTGNNNTTTTAEGQAGQPATNNNAGGGFMDKINNGLGGGASGEQNEDMLDKGVDFAQERFFGQGQQTNESAVEQQKDEAISDGIRNAAKKAGFEIPIKDKS